MCENQWEYCTRGTHDSKRAWHVFTYKAELYSRDRPKKQAHLIHLPPHNPYGVEFLKYFINYLLQNMYAKFQKHSTKK